MKWDAGALSEYRNNSPIFRFLSNNPPRSICWPEKWLNELGIFLATPDISWGWVQHNFNMTTRRLHGVWRKTAHLHHLGMENIYSATETDALMYMRNRPYQGLVPFWVAPFMIDSVKEGTSFRETARKWNISETHLNRHVQGRLNHDVFHTGGNFRRRNMARRV